MPVTLEDIAEVSGYSRSTVSRVINGEPGVSHRARQKITDVVEQLNYHPNQAARGLAAGQMNNIGLIIPETVSFIFNDPYFQFLSLGVSQTSNEQDFSVMLWLSDPDLERKSINKFLNNGLVDGFIIASMLMGDPIIEALKSTPRPFVLVGRQPALPDASVVDCDNVQGAYAATQHLLKTGRKRIATITGSEGMQSGINRIEGYQKALQDWGLTVNHALIAKGDYTESSGYFGMFQLLPEKPDAVFIASDNMAHGAYRALKEVGIRVPDDIAIVGFDDIPSADQMTPPLTTMRQPIRKMGNLAAEILINKINYPDTDSQRIILNPELVVRQSCGSSALAGSITLR